jgi:sulfatase modifying factor 1
MRNHEFVDRFQGDQTLHGDVGVNKPGCCSPQATHHPGIQHQFTQTITGTSAGNQSSARERPMISLSGGEFLMGTDYEGGFPADGEGPVRVVTLSPFQLDTFPVTNSDFAAFVKATGYRTEAEQFGWSFVFWAHIPGNLFEKLVEDTVAAAPWWCKVPDSSWSQPEGPGSNIYSRESHPVVHVSWQDASAYADWAHRRLPTEAEWEYAARGGLVQKLYPWGDELTPDGEHRSNIWQGEFPFNDTAEDGYAGTCPVDAFPPNGYGFYSMTGNVWEWCADWFGSSSSSTTAAHNPTGPLIGTSKVMKGGSFLCHVSYCNRYRVAARTSNTPDSSASNIGFRCTQRLG